MEVYKFCSGCWCVRVCACVCVCVCESMLRVRASAKTEPMQMTLADVFWRPGCVRHGATHRIKAGTHVTWGRI